MKKLKYLNCLIITTIACLVTGQTIAGNQVLSTSIVEERVKDLTTQIHWYKSLKEAEVEAQAQHKMIFWLQMLGDIDGGTWSAGNSLRAVSLSVPPAFDDLKDNFICGYTDIKHKWYCGKSGKHEVNTVAVDTTDGAGPHNIQMFMLASDGTVLNCLPGFWESGDLNLELELAAELNKVYLDPNLSKEQKDKIFVQKQLNHILDHPMAMIKRSRMQGFDRQAEFKKNYIPDTVSNPDLYMQEKGKTASAQRAINVNYKAVSSDNNSNDSSSLRMTRLNPVALYRLRQKQVDPVFKTTDEIFHERMAANPFVPFNEFDTGSFVSYGTDHYDKGESKMTPGTNKLTSKHNINSLFNSIIKASPAGPAYNLIQLGTGNDHFVQSESD